MTFGELEMGTVFRLPDDPDSVVWVKMGFNWAESWDYRDDKVIPQDQLVFAEED